MEEADAKTVLNVEKMCSGEWVKNNLKDDEQNRDRKQNAAESRLPTMQMCQL